MCSFLLYFAEDTDGCQIYKGKIPLFQGKFFSLDFASPETHKSLGAPPNLKHFFSIETPSRNYLLCAENSSEKADWMKFIEEEIQRANENVENIKL